MKIILNGESRECAKSITLGKLITELDIKVKVMAAAVNMEVVKTQNWDSHVLKDEDKVELLHFVGGG